MLAGGRIVLDRKFSASDWARKVRACGATVTVAHGPMLEMIHAQPPSADDRQLPVTRLLACPMAKRIAAEFEERFELRGIEAYGMTEIGPPRYAADRRAVAAGVLWPHRFVDRLGDRIRRRVIVRPAPALRS